MKKLITLSLISVAGTLTTLIGFIFLLMNDATPWYTWIVFVGVIFTGASSKIPHAGMKNVKTVVQQKLNGKSMVLNHVAYINPNRYLITATDPAGDVLVFSVDAEGSLLMFENDKETVTKLLYQSYDSVIVDA